MQILLSHWFRLLRQRFDETTFENVTMTENHWMADRFEADRERLSAVAYRMLGSRSEAEDAVQETWVRLSRTDTSDVENMSGWLTTVIARVCLDMLRSRDSRREDSLTTGDSETADLPEDRANPEEQALIADSVGFALLVVLDTLTPTERLAFVLHDMFDLSFDEIGPIVGRTPTAARQLASRARRRVRGASPRHENRSRQREIVDAFLAASRGGDFDALLSLLDPDVVLRADEVAAVMGASVMGAAKEVRGARRVAETFAGRARGAQPALIGGAVGFAWAQAGETRVAFAMTITGDKITGIELIADPERLRELDVQFLD